MKTIIPGILALAVLAAGCAPKGFVKPGGTPEEFYRAKTDCQMKANQAGLYGWQALGFFNECMAGQGWYREE